MSPDILIIGAGISGLSSACFLAQKGLKVAVVDRGRAGGESSWAGGGILFPLLPWNYSERVVSIARAGWEAYPEWSRFLAEETGINPEYLRSGMKVFHADEMAADDWCEKNSFTLSKTADGALWLPEVSQVRNPRLIRALSALLRKLKVPLIEEREILSFEPAAGKIAALATRQGKLCAGKYLVASGAWSAKLLAARALSLDIRPVKGQMLLFRGKPGLLPSIMFDDGLYLIPRQDGHILVGSTLEHVGFDKSTTAELKIELTAKALALFPGLAQTEFVTHWAGLRPGSPGNMPTISRHPEIENLYVNSGHFRYGVTMAPAAAALVSQIITEGAASPYPWPHCPNPHESL